MKRFVLACVGVLLSCSVFAVTLDQGYIKAFGGGKVVVSGKALPALETYDASQFTFKDGKFFIAGGPDGFFNARALLPAGKTIGQLIDEAKKKFSANMEYFQSDVTCFRVWCSNGEDGNDQVGNAKWPTTLNEEPQWATQICDIQTDVDEERLTWVGQAATWESMQNDVAGYLAKARTGTKFFIQYSVGFTSLTPGGQMESKWDSVLEKFVQTPSQGLLSYNLMPVAVGTVEVAEGYTPTWTWKMITKPAKEDGKAEGLISIMKSGKEFCQAKVAVENKYLNKVTGVTAWTISFTHASDEGKRGGFDTDAKTVEKAIENVLEEYAERELAAE
ncbi:MAG: hypothetical protein ACD_73C00194G0001 [uncultured bacterium]|nr:MAG: hypothetical protein ACD_73C00194G0001 [uncultured bacterium]